MNHPCMAELRRSRFRRARTFLHFTAAERNRPARRAHALWALVLVALGGCPRLAPEHCSLYCGEAGACPQGFQCDPASELCASAERESFCAPGPRGCSSGHHESEDGTRCEQIEGPAHCSQDCSEEGECPEDFQCDPASGLCARAGEGSFCAPGVRGCSPGYRESEDGTRCEDVDECEVDNGGCAHDCEPSTVVGEPPRCSCREGFVSKQGGRSCVCEGGRVLGLDGRSCLPPDPCDDDNNGGCSHLCTRPYAAGAPAKCLCPPQLVLGEGGQCRCPEGFELDPDGVTCRCQADLDPLPIMELSGKVTLWLDWECLPPADVPLVEWCDRSGDLHHGVAAATAIEQPQLLARALPDTAARYLDMPPYQWLMTRQGDRMHSNEAFQFGTDDFYLLIVGSFRHENPDDRQGLCIATNALGPDRSDAFMPSTGFVFLHEREERDLKLWVLRPSDETAWQDRLIVNAEPGQARLDGEIHQYALRRRGDALELRVDGVRVGEGPLPAGTSFSSDENEDLALGTCNRWGRAMQSRFLAVVAVTRPSDQDVAAIEAHFRDALLRAP